MALESASSTMFGEPCGRIKEQVCGALAMIEFAVESGFKNAQGQSISQDVITTIQSVAASVGLLDTKSETSASDATLAGTVTTQQWVAFEVAYYQLSTTMAPITAETLRNTEGTSREPEPLVGHNTATRRLSLSSVGTFVLGYSPAHRFTRALWLVAIGFALFVVLSDWYLQYIAPEGDDSIYRKSRLLIQLLVPWAYGGLGSCVYLLKSAHIYIYQRTFDLRRKHEYFNRILLGTIAGGAIILFVNQITGEGGVAIQLSSGALGFLAGYSTDFLFNTIERIIAAVLPKVGLDSVQRADQQGKPRVAPPLDLKDLADRYDKSDGQSKDFYKTLIEHASGVPPKTGEAAAAPSRARRRSRSQRPGEPSGNA